MEIITILRTTAWFSLSLLSGIVGLNVPQKYRPLVLLSLVSFALLAFWNVSDAKFGIKGTESVAMLIVIYISHMTCVLCVEQYHLPTKAGITFDFVGGYKMIFNARWLGTPRQSPNIHLDKPMEKECTSPSDKESKLTDSSPIRTILQKPRAVFLRNRLISLFTISAILQSYNYLFEKYIVLEGTDFLPTKLTYFRRFPTVTLRETLVRTWLVSYWTFYSVGLYTALHDLLALFFVGTCLDTPAEWPQLFGSIKDATSIRGFWGRYWHRLVYRSYTSYGVFISKNIFRLPQNSIVGRMFINLYVFAMSGVAHAVAVRQLGFSCGYWEEIRFYSSGFLGILHETLVLAAFKKITGGYKVNQTLGNAVGYAWVFLYLFTVLPKSQYPKLWCAPSF